MDLVLYGSFNCPYSFLASLRADRLVTCGEAAVDWWAVVHDPDVPLGGIPVAGELATMFDRELDEIRGLLGNGESYPARRPQIQPNTTAAVAGYATLHGDDADHLRRLLFSAFWGHSADIGDSAILTSLGCPTTPPGATMRRWAGEWQRIEHTAVPLIILPDGTVRRGLEALGHLADQLNEIRPEHHTHLR